MIRYTYRNDRRIFTRHHRVTPSVLAQKDHRSDLSYADAERCLKWQRHARSTTGSSGERRRRPRARLDTTRATAPDPSERPTRRGPRTPPAILLVLRTASDRRFTAEGPSVLSSRGDAMYLAPRVDPIFTISPASSILLSSASTVDSAIFRRTASTGWRPRRGMPRRLCLRPIPAVEPTTLWC